MDDEAPPPAATAAEPDGRARSHRAPIVAIVALLAVLGGVAFAAVNRADGGGAEDPDTADATGEPDPPAGDEPGIGDEAALDGGGAARLNAVTTDVSLDPGLPGPEAGTRLDRLDVELCAGEEELFVDAAFWVGLGEDGRVHSAHMGVRDLVTLSLTPGFCQRGTVDVAMPEDVELVDVILMNMERETAARWAARGQSQDLEPLRADTEPGAAGVGEPADLLTGGTVTLHEVMLHADPVAGGPAPETGETLVRLDGEVCAGEQGAQVSPRHWFVQLEDNRWVLAERAGSTLETATVEPGTCARGTAEFLVPGSAPAVGVIYGYPGGFTELRWALD